MLDAVGIEMGFEEEGVVAFVGVDGDVLHGDAVSLELLDDVFLLVGVEADIGVDAEDEVVLMLAAVEDLGIVRCTAVAEEMVFDPPGAEVEVGVGVEAPDKFTALVEDVGFERGFDLVP